jgi:hypothetical protein
MWRSLLRSYLRDDGHSDLFVVDKQGKRGAKELWFEYHVDITESAVIGCTKIVQIVERGVHVACLHAASCCPCIVQECDWRSGCQSCYLDLQVRVCSIIGDQYPVPVCRIVKIASCSDSIHNNVDVFTARRDDNISMRNCWADKSNPRSQSRIGAEKSPSIIGHSCNCMAVSTG